MYLVEVTQPLQNPQQHQVQEASLSAVSHIAVRTLWVCVSMNGGGGCGGQLKNKSLKTDWGFCHSYVTYPAASCKYSFSRNYRWVIMQEVYWHCATNWLGEVFKKLFIWTFHRKVNRVFTDSEPSRRNKGRWSLLTLPCCSGSTPYPYL